MAPQCEGQVGSRRNPDNYLEIFPAHRCNRRATKGKLCDQHAKAQERARKPRTPREAALMKRIAELEAEVKALRGTQPNTELEQECSSDHCEYPYGPCCGVYPRNQARRANA